MDEAGFRTALNAMSGTPLADAQWEGCGNHRRKQPSERRDIEATGCRWTWDNEAEAMAGVLAAAREAVFSEGRFWVACGEPVRRAVSEINSTYVELTGIDPRDRTDVLRNTGHRPIFRADRMDEALASLEEPSRGRKSIWGGVPRAPLPAGPEEKGPKTTAGRLGKGFCRTLYRRAQGLNLHIARSVSRRILSFAAEHGATVIVFENLKGFRPKGGAKRSTLRARFHGWLHRLTVRQAQQSAEERGIRVSFVPPRGTSAWAYDGSGRVVRDKFNYGRCRFRSGKEYDCDLSAAYNIAARFFDRRARLLSCKSAERREVGRQTAAEDRRKSSPAGGKTGWPVRGKSSAAGPRAPVTLSSFWDTPSRAAA